MSEYETAEQALEHADYIADRYIYDWQSGLIIDTEKNVIVTEGNFLI